MVRDGAKKRLLTMRNCNEELLPEALA